MTMCIHEQDIENRMANDRCWPTAKQMHRESCIDAYVLEAMQSDWEWLDSLSQDDMREIVSEVTHAAWRGGYKAESDRMNAIKASLLSFIEPWAERMADDE